MIGHTDSYKEYLKFSLKALRNDNKTPPLLIQRKRELFEKELEEEEQISKLLSNKFS